MCFAEMIAIERKDISTVSNTVNPFVSTSTETKGKGNITLVESDIVINSAVTLCGVAAKKVC